MENFTRGENRVYLGDDSAEPLAEITFRREAGGLIVIDHTFVADALRGQGVGARLVGEAVALAREEGAMIRPDCPYAKKLMLRTPEYADLLLVGEEAHVTERKVDRVMPGVETRDGAGVRLRRVFSNRDVAALDPFLLFDVFGSDEAKDYLAGFPMHPHRGIETVTFMLAGRVRHRDSLGNAGTIGAGDLQWMSAGSGIIHEEMPQESPGGLRGLQLWVNLPKAEKMRDPAYRDASKADIPSVAVPGGEVRPIAGSFDGVAGPLTGIARDPAYFDARLEAGAAAAFPSPATQTMFAYVYEGSLGMAAEADGKHYPAGSCLLFGPGDRASLKAGPGGARFVLARAEPLRESIAWGGPIVMNTQEELEQAFAELDQGSFIKAGRTGGRRP